MTPGTSRTTSIAPADMVTSAAILHNQARCSAPPALIGDSGYSPPSLTGKGQDFALAKLPPGSVRVGNVIYTASSLLQQLRNWQEFSQLEEAIKRFGLDRGNASHVLSAYAYVWGRNIAPLRYWRLPYAGHRSGANERFAQALGRYERDNPGTVFLFERGSRAAKEAIENILDRVLAGAVVNPPLQVFERTSKVAPALSTSSRKARTILGILFNQSWSAHHLIPFETIATLPESVQRVIVSSGWSMDSAENLMALPTNWAAYIGPPNVRFRPMHIGSHRLYNATASTLLAPLSRNISAMGAQNVRAHLLTVETYFRNVLIIDRSAWHPKVK